MKALVTFLALVAVLSVATARAVADWDPNDPHKMHFPQLPNPQGWDVQAQDYPLADDWMCSQSGYVTDIHLWFSLEYGADPFTMNSVFITIYADIPDDPCNPDDYSMPGAVLWGGKSFPAGSFTIRQAGTGDEGWYDPVDDWYREHDHNTYYQLNITDITDPFYQDQGTIYWLSVQFDATSDAGWKTSLEQWNDDAVYWDYSSAVGWQPLKDPIAGQSLDLAFVITPEPATLALLAAGGLALIRRRKR